MDCIIVERIKFLRYNNILTSQYFWRTTKQREIDLIEEHNGKLNAYEFKWSKNKKVRFPQTFTDNYPGSGTFIISPDNVEDFLLSRE